MAWAKALVEIAISNNKQAKVVIPFDDIAEKFLKYYWNQTIYFDLTQGANLKKPPEILTYTKDLIFEYQQVTGTMQPIRFEKVDFNKLKLNNSYIKTIRKIGNTLKNDVCWRFLNLDKKAYPLYELNKSNRIVTLHQSQVESIKAYYESLLPIINYRWTQMLESFNFAPRISKKVRAIDEDNVRRKSLTKFRKYLDTTNDKEKRVCFYCGEQMQNDEISIDHVIPWSFIFADDLWNLVYCHKSENSKKSNRLPVEADIQKLENRNLKLVESMRKADKTNSKHYDQLQLAIEKDYVRQFWISFKG